MDAWLTPAWCGWTEKQTPWKWGKAKGIAHDWQGLQTGYVSECSLFSALDSAHSPVICLRLWLEVVVSYHVGFWELNWGPLKEESELLSVPSASFTLPLLSYFPGVIERKGFLNILTAVTGKSSSSGTWQSGQQLSGIERDSCLRLFMKVLPSNLQYLKAHRREFLPQIVSNEIIFVKCF